MQRVTLTLDDDLLAALDALSARRGYHNRSEAVRDILRDALNQDPPSPESRRGYAVLPYATEYRENRIALDTNTLADNVDLDDAVVSVVPTHGAIVRANFNAQVGMKILMTLTHRGKPVPFGALATGDSNQSGSIVADNGQVYLS
ncbi:MAG: fimbria/pilus outer membrane usher protein, partial [Enterobacter hormaechei]|nr:fimbria/pilus outer membrane usher protein [Enterobacter hormaechei]